MRFSTKNEGDDANPLFRFARWLHANWRLWLGVFLALGIIGWLSLRVVERELKDNLSEQLQTTLNANVNSLKIWMDEKKAAARILSRHLLFPKTLSLLEKTSKGNLSKENLLATEELSWIRKRFAEIGLYSGFVGFVLLDRDGLQVAALADEAIGQNYLAKRFDFIQQSLRGETAISLPLPAETSLSLSRGVLREGQPTMFVSTPCYNESGEIIGAYAFRIQPETEFSRVFNIARWGVSGETYAIDSAGRMLSESRFNKQLKATRLIPDLPNGKSTLNVYVRDPGGNLLEGFRPSTPREQWPLTKMAADIVKGKPGRDLDGYNDYRGVPVVGAWRWLPEHGFGVATEMDMDEAFGPLNALRNIFLILFGLLAFSMVSILLLRGVQVAAERRRLATETELEKIHDQMAHSEKLSALGKMAASVAHEISAPVSGVRNILEKAFDEGSFDGELRDLLALGVKECRRMERFVQLLRGFYKPSAKTVAPLNIHDVIDETVALIRTKLRERKIKLERRYAPDMVNMVAAEDQIKEAILNLVQNAEESIPETGGKITISTQADPASIEIQIQDTGCGIPPERLQTIFEPFFTTKGEGKGTGLGLSITQEIVKRHGGSLEVTSQPGKGSTFVVRLPAGPRPEPR